MKYKVLNSFSYGGKDYNAGDVIKLADEKEAKPLIGNGVISDKKEKETPVKPKVYEDPEEVREELQKLAEGEEECNEGVELGDKPKAKAKPEVKLEAKPKTNDQLKEELDKLKIEYPKKAIKADLEKLLKKAEK